jgi:uncharacterized Zn finger protein
MRPGDTCSSCGGVLVKLVTWGERSILTGAAVPGERRRVAARCSSCGAVYSSVLEDGDGDQGALFEEV